MNARLAAWVVASALLLGGCVADSSDDAETTAPGVAITATSTTTTTLGTSGAPTATSPVHADTSAVVTADETDDDDDDGIESSTDPDPHPWWPDPVNPCTPGEPCADVAMQPTTMSAP